MTKNYLLYIVAIVIFLSILVSPAKAENSLSFGFFVGLSTPNDKIADIYNKDKVTADEYLGDFKREAISAGYHLGFQLRLKASDMISLYGGLAFNRFPVSDIEVYHPENEELLASLRATTNVVPIYAGVNLHPIKLGFLVPYLTASLNYNYISSSVDITYSDITFPYSTSPAYSRLGYGLGAGLDIELKLLTLYVEGKYNELNLIGSEESEKSKNYLSLTFGIIF